MPGQSSDGLTAHGLTVAAVGPINLAVSPGECLALTGPSGAGKSLTLRMLADLVPHAGTCRLGEVDCAEVSGPRWRAMVRYVSSEPGWWAPTIAEHFSDAAGQMERLKKLGLDKSLMDAPPDRLSTGERQRMAFLRAIEGRPKVLLLDEPTSALDPASVASVEAVIREELAGGTAVVITSHDPEQVERLADRVMTLPGRHA